MVGVIPRETKIGNELGREDLNKEERYATMMLK